MNYLFGRWPDFSLEQPILLYFLPLLNIRGVQRGCNRFNSYRIIDRKCLINTRFEVLVYHRQPNFKTSKNEIYICSWGIWKISINISTVSAQNSLLLSKEQSLKIFTPGYQLSLWEYHFYIIYLHHLQRSLNILLIPQSLFVPKPI